MLHFLIGLGLLAGLLYFVFGERTARLFVGWTLVAASCWCLLLLGIAAMDLARHSHAVKHINTAPQTVVRVAPQDLAAIWDRIDARDARR